MLNLVLFGPPGCGKGTQSARVACRFNLLHLSTGELFRAEVKRRTPLGNELAGYMKKGLLVPDSIVLKYVYKTAIKDINGPGFIFDGFPRTIAQAEVMDKLLIKKNLIIDIVLCLIVEKQELFDRMIGRSEDSGRSDDNEKIIYRRMEVYEEQTKPLKEYYLKQNKVSFISGMAPVKVVAERIAHVIRHYIHEKEILREVMG